MEALLFDDGAQDFATGWLTAHLEDRMMDQENIGEEQVEQIEHYNPVTVTISESTGVVAILVVALILLAALLRSQARIRELQEQLGQQEEN